MEENQFFDEQEPQGPVVHLTAEEAQRIQAGFMARVYGWMAAGLACTGVVALFTVTTEPLLRFIFETPFVYLALILGTLLLVGFMSARVFDWSLGQVQAAFLAYSVLNGLTLSVVFLRYTADSISTTFFTAACMFAVMSVFGFVTKSNLLGWGKLLSMALIGLLLAVVLNLFLNNSTLDLIVSGVGVLLFTALAAYDTQKLKQLALLQVTEGEVVAQKASLLGALTLYLDFLNLFLFLLRLFGRRQQPETRKTPAAAVAGVF